MGSFSDYQELAKKTASDLQDEQTRKLIFALGLCGEAGEVADIVKKEAGHLHLTSISSIKKELGDVLWYMAVLADLYGLDLEDVAIENIEKLTKRYPDGFDPSKSQNRDEESEPFDEESEPFLDYSRPRIEEREVEPHVNYGYPKELNDD